MNYLQHQLNGIIQMEDNEIEYVKQVERCVVIKYMNFIDIYMIDIQNQTVFPQILRFERKNVNGFFLNMDENKLLILEGDILYQLNFDINLFSLLDDFQIIQIHTVSEIQLPIDKYQSPKYYITSNFINNSKINQIIVKNNNNFLIIEPHNQQITYEHTNNSKQLLVIQVGGNILALNEDGIIYLLNNYAKMQTVAQLGVPQFDLYDENQQTIFESNGQDYVIILTKQSIYLYCLQGSDDTVRLDLIHKQNNIFFANNIVVSGVQFSSYYDQLSKQNQIFIAFLLNYYDKQQQLQSMKLYSVSINNFKQVNQFQNINSYQQSMIDVNQLIQQNCQQYDNIVIENVCLDSTSFLVNCSCENQKTCIFILLSFQLTQIQLLNEQLNQKYFFNNVLDANAQLKFIDEKEQKSKINAAINEQNNEIEQYCRIELPQNHMLNFQSNKIQQKLNLLLEQKKKDKKSDKPVMFHPQQYIKSNINSSIVLCRKHSTKLKCDQQNIQNYESLVDKKISNTETSKKFKSLPQKQQKLIINQQFKKIATIKSDKQVNNIQQLNQELFISQTNSSLLFSSYQQNKLKLLFSYPLSKPIKQYSVDSTGQFLAISSNSSFKIIDTNTKQQILTDFQLNCQQYQQKITQYHEPSFLSFLNTNYNIFNYKQTKSTYNNIVVSTLLNQLNFSYFIHNFQDKYKSFQINNHFSVQLEQNVQCGAVFQNRISPHIFLGFAPGNKGLIVYDIIRQKETFCIDQSESVKTPQFICLNDLNKQSGNDYNVFATHNLQNDGQNCVMLYDIRMQNQIRSFYYSQSKRKSQPVTFIKNYQIAVCLDSNIGIYDIRQGKYTTNVIQSINKGLTCICGCNDYFISAQSDGEVGLWS